jgi:translation elongation factor EF-G
VVACLPAPIDVPAVRGTISGTAGGTADNAVAERPADPAAPLAALAFKVAATPTGRLSYLRINSGTMRKGTQARDAGTGRMERISRLLRVQADRLSEVDGAVAGDIAWSPGRQRVAYQETVVRGVSGLVYRHVKQDGGAGQFAHVVLDVSPAGTAGLTVVGTTAKWTANHGSGGDNGT